MPALALTDRDGLHGSVEFVDACNREGVRPILGLELTVAPPPNWPEAARGEIALFAADRAGWASLCRLTSALQTAPHRDPSRGLPLDELSKHAAGLLCLAGGAQSAASRLARAAEDQLATRHLGLLRDLYTDCLYVELQRTTPEQAAIGDRLLSAAREHRLPIVATHGIYYLRPEQAPLQRLLTAIRLNRPLGELPADPHATAPDAPAPLNSHFVSAADLARRFADLPQAITATREIADRCTLELPLGVPHYPEITLPDGMTAAEALRVRALEGAARLYGQFGDGVRERLEHELTIIVERGYAPLFLIMEEVVQHARQTGVPMSSRGSAASSLVAHCLGITSPDPIRLDLYFERFLNPARATPPDIDTDLCSRRRHGVIRQVYRRYGHDCVAMVCTVNRFRARSALRETAKAHGLSPENVKALTESVAQRGWGPPVGDGGAKGESPYAELAARYPSPVHQRIFRDAESLLGMPRHLSIHPGGVVISPGPMTDLVPVQRSSQNMIVTQFDLDSVERMGLVKIDLLGIRGLTVLGDVAEAVHAQRPGEFGSPLGALESIPDDDPGTAEMVRAGRTIGCFQIESPGMRATLKEIGACGVDDLMVALALYRPGPLTGGLKDAFVRRHRGQEPTRHLHPALAPLLADTHGVILYQEQVLRIAHQLAGLSLAEADLLRRAMSHFDPGKQMQTLKEKFLAGAFAQSGVPPEVAERVWELMAAFAGYGFPKAHAASYAQVAWRAAWCKTHHPAEFMAAVLANWGGYYGQRVYLTEARRLGLTIRPPDVNHAREEFSVTHREGKPVLTMGLNQVKELTRVTQARIVRERPFRSLADFLARADPRPAEARHLVLAGALDELGPAPALLRQLETGSWRRHQLSLFDAEPAGGGDWPLAEKVAAQESVLGVSVAAHPLELAADRIVAAAALTTLEAAARVGERVRVVGMRQAWRRTQTTRGDHTYFMSLEDLEGMLDVVIYSEVYRRHKPAFTSGVPLVVEGVVSLDQERGEPSIRAEKVWRLG